MRSEPETDLESRGDWENESTLVLRQTRVDCSLWVEGEVLLQVEELKYFVVLFTSEGRMNCEIDRGNGAASC